MTKNISEEDLLYIELIGDCQSNRENDHQNAVDTLLLHAASIGLWMINESKSGGDSSESGGPHIDQQVAELDNDLEVMWTSTYEQRKVLNKEKWQTAGKVELNSAEGCLATDMQDGSVFRAAVNQASIEPCFVQSMEVESPYQDVSLAKLVRAWNLNLEQERAFRIVASHSLGKGDNSLRMFLTGPAGIGKLQVIDALKDYFKKRNQV